MLNICCAHLPSCSVHCGYWLVSMTIIIYLLTDTTWRSTRGADTLVSVVRGTGWDRGGQDMPAALFLDSSQHLLEWLVHSLMFAMFASDISVSRWSLWKSIVPYPTFPFYYWLYIRLSLITRTKREKGPQTPKMCRDAKFFLPHPAIFLSLTDGEQKNEDCHGWHQCHIMLVLC